MSKRVNLTRIGIHREFRAEIQQKPNANQTSINDSSNGFESTVKFTEIELRCQQYKYLL